MAGHVLERKRLLREGAMQIRMKWRSAVARTVNDVHFVALFEEQGCPTTTPIRSTHPIGALSSAAVHQHDRVRVADARWDLILNVHLLTVDNRAAGKIGTLDTHPEVAPLGNVERRSLYTGAVSLGFSCLCFQLSAFHQRQAAGCKSSKIPAG